MLDGNLPATIPVPLARASIGEARLVQNVVIRLVDGLWDLRHDVTMNNFFSNIGLFHGTFSTRHLCYGNYPFQSCRASISSKEYKNVLEFFARDNIMADA